MEKKNFRNKFVDNLEKFNQEQISNYIRSLDDEKNHITFLLESLGLGICEIDSSGKILYLNREAQKLIQCPLEKVKGSDFSSLDIDTGLKLIFNQAISGNVIRGEEIFISNNKKSLCRVNAFPKVVQGKIEGFIFTIEDETESNNKRQQSLHNKSIASLAVLTAGIAHEIKNPLGSLDLHIQLIQRFIKSRTIPDKMELFDLTKVVSEEINRLNEIVNDFLFSVRPIRSKKRPENLNGIIDEVLKIVEPEINAKDIILRLELSKLDIIPVDKNYIKQSLINIIQNAIHAVDDNKDNSYIQIKTSQDNKQISLFIKDNGVGIEEKDLANIFDPFFSTKSKGTGLGLTIVYKIIKEHKGEIILTSQRGKGAEFRINLPRTPNKFLPGK